MYDLGAPFDHRSLPPGTNLLVTGPPLTGKRRLGMRILAAEPAADESAIVVSTRDGADRIREDYERQVADPASATVGIVDSVTAFRDRPVRDGDDVRYAASPRDMTTIGIEFSSLLDEFRSRRDFDGTRVLVDSLTTLLLYADDETVFRFARVIANRVEDADALGVSIVDSTAHDPETLDTLEGLYDGVVETDEDGGASATLPGSDPITLTL